MLTPLASQLDVRGLNREDAPLLEAHLLRLQASDRHARFHGGMKDVAVSNYVGRMDWPRTYIFGALVDGTLRGVAELVTSQAGTDAEVAVSIESEFQHAGLGRMLVLAAMLAARRLAISVIRLTFQPENRGMRLLARDLGARVTRTDPTELTATITLFAGTDPALT